MGKNADLLREGIDLLNQGKIREVVDRYADDVVLEFRGSVLGGAYKGKQGAGQFFQKLGATFPGGAHIQIKNIYEAGETVVAEWTFRGKLANGREYNAPGLHVFEVRGEKLVDQRGYFDTEELANLLEKM